jgi:hypothetical protein
VPLDGAGKAIAGGVHRIERGGLHGVVGVPGVLDRLRGDLRDLRGGFVRLLQRVAGHFLRRVRCLLRRLLDLRRSLRDVVLEPRQPALDAP